MCVYSGTFSEQGLARVPCNLLTCGIAESSDFVRVGGFGLGRFWPQRRRERDGNRCWARQNHSIAQKVARPGKRYGNNRNSSNDRCIERAELKRADAYFSNERTFRKDENRIPIANLGFNLLSGFAPGVGVGTNKGKVPHLTKERPNERHLVNFAFGD